MDFFAFLVFSIAVPIVINKTTESTHFDTWKPRLREIWMLIFVLASAYFLFKPEAKDSFMKLHASHPGFLGYLVVALLGAISLCLYWAFTGFLTPVAQPAKHVFSVPRTDFESSTFFDQIPSDQLTLRDLFAHDFTEKASVIKFSGQLENHNVPPGMTTAIPYYLVFEQDSHSKFVELYIPATTMLRPILVGFARDFQPVLNAVSGGDVNITMRPKLGDGVPYNTKDSVFSGQVYIYSELDLNADDLGLVYNEFKANNLQLQFRSLGYVDGAMAAKRLAQK